MMSREMPWMAWPMSLAYLAPRVGSPEPAVSTRASYVLLPLFLRKWSPGRARGPDGIFRSTGMLSLGTRINGAVYARRAQRRRGGRDGRPCHVCAAGAEVKMHQRAVLLR